MSASEPMHRRIQVLVDAANDALPSGYVLGYHLIHTDVDEALIDAADAEMKRIWRTRLASDPRASADITNIPTDASAGTGRHILFEIVHLTTGIRAVATYSVQSMSDLITGPGTIAQKRTTVRNQIAALYTTCRDRVVAAGGG